MTQRTLAEMPQERHTQPQGYALPGLGESIPVFGCSVWSNQTSERPDTGKQVAEATERPEPRSL